MTVTLRPALAAIAVAVSVAVTACGPARVGAPVPRPFPSPSRIVVDTDSEGRPAATDWDARPAAAAQGSGVDFPRYLGLLQAVETGGDCFARPPGGSAIGCYQMTRAALVDAGLKDAAGNWLDNAWGIDSDDEFRSDRRAQDAAMLRYTAGNWLKVEPCVRDLVGRTVGDVVIDQAALLAGAHLLGATGLVRFVRCGMTVRCIAPEMAALNGGRRNLHASAVRRMHAVHGLRVLASTAGSGTRCGLRG